MVEPRVAANKPCSRTVAVLCFNFWHCSVPDVLIDPSYVYPTFASLGGSLASVELKDRIRVVSQLDSHDRGLRIMLIPVLTLEECEPALATIRALDRLDHVLYCFAPSDNGLSPHIVEHIDYFLEPLSDVRSTIVFTNCENMTEHDIQESIRKFSDSPCTTEIAKRVNSIHPMGALREYTNMFVDVTPYNVQKMRDNMLDHIFSEDASDNSN